MKSKTIATSLAALLIGTASVTDSYSLELGTEERQQELESMVSSGGITIDFIYNSGLMHLINKNMDGAIDNFIFIIDHDSTHANAYYGLAKALEGKSRLEENPDLFDEAVNNINHALQIDSTFSSAAYSAALWLHKRDRSDESVPFFERAVANFDISATSNVDKATKKKHSMHIIIANYYFDLARHEFDTSGLTENNEGLFDKARAHYERAQDLSDLNSSKQRNLDWLNFVLSKDKLSSLQKLVTDNPDNVGYHLSFAKQLNTNGMRNDAIKVYERILVLPNNQAALEQTLLSLADLYSELPVINSPDNDKKVVDVLERAFDINPNNQNTVDRLVNLYLDQDNTDGAIAVYTRLIDLNEDDFYFRTKLAGIHASLGNYSESISQYNQLDSLAPDMHDQLSDWYLQLDDFDSAKAQLDSALKKDESSNVYYQNKYADLCIDEASIILAGNLHDKIDLARGLYDDAEERYNRVKDQDPDYDGRIGYLSGLREDMLKQSFFGE